MYSSSVDYDSNRRLFATAKGTESAVLSADFRFERAMEDSELSIEPRYALRRYSDSTLGNGDDRGITAGFSYLGERSQTQLTASYVDQSTLLSELLETGITSVDTHRRQTQIQDTWSWSQTERRQLISQLSYLDVSYYGQARAQLPGFRYPSGSVGERFLFSENGSFTVSAFGSELSSDARGGTSHEYGVEAEVIYFFSERTHFDGSIGESSRLLTGQTSHGTDASVSLTHDMTRGNLALTYTRSLTPYGIGYLVEKQQETVSGLYRMTPYLDANISAFRIQNSEIAVRLGLDRRSLDSVSTGLTWRPLETFNVGVQIGGIRTQTPVPSGFQLQERTVTEWRTSATMTWTPFPRTRSW